MSRVHGAEAQDVDAVIGAHPYGSALSVYAAAGGEESVPGSEFATRGFRVKIKKLVGTGDDAYTDLLNKRLDVAVLSTDLAARLAAGDKAGKVKTILLISYSQGSLGLVAQDQYLTVRSLSAARVGVPEYSPSHYYLTKLLRAYGVPLSKVKTVATDTTAKADDLLRTSQVEAAVLWTPYLTRALKRPSMSLVASTREGDQLISSVLVARTEWLDQHDARIPDFIAAWMAGVRRTQSDVVESTRVIAQATDLDDTEVYEALARSKQTSLSDNAEFMGLSGKGPFIRYERDVQDALRTWRELKAIPPGDDVVRPALRSQYVKALLPRKAPVPQPEPDRKAGTQHSNALAKNVYFAKGKVTLDARAKQVIREFAEDEAHGFGGSRIRIEGNADAPKEGPKANRALQRANLSYSVQRAMAVATELITVHGIEPDRLIVVGNGAQRNDEEKNDVDHNRRTEFYFE